jgi:predicted O-methyltransferase YrrM
MANSLSSPQLTRVLTRLLDEASHDSHDAPPPPAGHSSWATASVADRCDAFQGLYLPISAEAGTLLYVLARAIRPATVVEFGTSFGISTIYLAAAVTDNGSGHVVTTELSGRKAQAARANLNQAGVGDAVTILAGDARQTLASQPGPLGMVLLDGWKDLCLPVLRVLEPKLAPGALVAADDTTHAGLAGYLSHIRDPAHGYVTVTFPVQDGIELSSWTGASSTPAPTPGHPPAASHGRRPPRRGT